MSARAPLTQAQARAKAPRASIHFPCRCCCRLQLFCQRAPPTPPIKLLESPSALQAATLACCTRHKHNPTPSLGFQSYITPACRLFDPTGARLCPPRPLRFPY